MQISHRNLDDSLHKVGTKLCSAQNCSYLGLKCAKRYICFIYIHSGFSEADYLEYLVPLPILDIIICPILDYYILSIFHNLGSPLNYHTLIFDLMSSRNMYLYNAYIYTYILWYLPDQRSEPQAFL